MSTNTFIVEVLEQACKVGIILIAIFSDPESETGFKGHGQVSHPGELVPEATSLTTLTSPNIALQIKMHLDILAHA